MCKINVIINGRSFYNKALTHMYVVIGNFGIKCIQIYRKII